MPDHDAPTSPGSDASDAARREALLLQVRRVAEAVEALQHAWAEVADLHRSDLAAVTHLASAGRPLTMRELADRVAHSPGATTAVVDRLEGRGQAVRGRDPDDGRRVTVRLSPSAEALGGAFFGQLAGRVREVLDGFDADELECSSASWPNCRRRSHRSCPRGRDRPPVRPADLLPPVRPLTVPSPRRTLPTERSGGTPGRGSRAARRRTTAGRPT